MMDVLKYLLQSNNTHSDSLERNREVRTRLKFISRIQPGEKVNVKNLRIENTNILTPFMRAIFGESRDTLISFLSSTIDVSFEILQAYVASKKIADQIICAHIMKDLVNSIKGLDSIKRTYEDDKMLGGRVDTLIETINAKVQEYECDYPEIFRLRVIGDKVVQNLAEEDEQDLKDHPALGLSPSARSLKPQN